VRVIPDASLTLILDPESHNVVDVHAGAHEIAADRGGSVELDRATHGCAEPSDLGACRPRRQRPVMADMGVIVRLQDQWPCASITCMIRHYVSPKGAVIFDHPHNAESSALLCWIIMLGGAYPCADS
jgi:hypothetical protein